MLSLTLGLAGCAQMGGGPEDHGQRTYGMQVEDQGIENRIKSNLSRQDARFNDARVNIDSYNGIVLMTGQVPSEELKEKAQAIASEAQHVRRVHNELTVAANIPLAQRTSDTWLATRIRTNLIANENIDAGRIRVVTENASVYLMGIVTRAESDQIVSVVSQLGGIQRIVKAFEYLD
ncbi:BON domain-containing protein [Halomonas sp. PA5]|nr:BON domain-containing protein [Halomonas sp. PA5]